MSEFSQDEETGGGEITLVDEAKAELQAIETSELGEHSARFEALHGKLQEALSTIDGL